MLLLFQEGHFMKSAQGHLERRCQGTRRAERRPQCPEPSGRWRSGRRTRHPPEGWSGCCPTAGPDPAPRSGRDTRSRSQTLPGTADSERERERRRWRRKVENNEREEGGGGGGREGNRERQRMRFSLVAVSQRSSLRLCKTSPHLDASKFGLV